MPIKTTVSATVLEEALNGTVTIRPLELGQPLSRKVCTWIHCIPGHSEFYANLSFQHFVQVEKQCAHFYSVTITEEEAQSGFVCRVLSADKSKFKVYCNQKTSSISFFDEVIIFCVISWLNIGDFEAGKCSCLFPSLKQL